MGPLSLRRGERRTVVLRRQDQANHPTVLGKNSRLSVSVVIPTFRRAGLLRLCLAGLRAQSKPPDQIVVVCRANDGGTEESLREVDDALMTVILVNSVGVLSAMEAGIHAADGNVIAFTHA